MDDGAPVEIEARPAAPLAQPPTYFKPTPNASLEQGDLIAKDSEVVRGALTTYHRYHVEHPANELFAVLTQSCDLERRNGHCKARYISLAPVRSLRSVVAREFDKFLLRTPGGQYVIGSSATEARYQDFLAKLINNNDSRHFFLPARPQIGLPEDYCIILPLALPIKAEHYDACISGRIAQLDDLFQAKLGWLLGQQYSRVGTPDWPDRALEEKIASLSERALTWFPENDFEQIKKLVAKFELERPDQSIGEEEFDALRRGVKNRKLLAIECIFDLLSDHVPPPGKERANLRRTLQQDPTFAKFFPAS
jgi:hypothetical protein